MNETVSNKFLIILIIISLITILFFKINNNSKTISVFNENHIYESYIIDFEDTYVTSKNIDNYISDEIEAIYPLIDKKYESVVKSSWYNIDKLLNKDSNITKMEEYYEDIFNKNTWNEEAININLNGIRIKKVRVLTNNINKYKNYKIKKIYVV